MSDTDSFIEEVTEEVRRDKLFALMKKYGWIAAVAVVAIVGSAAFNEYRKAQHTAAAQQLGDDLVAALTSDDAAARATALNGVQAPSPAAAALVAMLRAAEMASAGDAAGAVALLDSIASNGEVPMVYRQVASFKSLLVPGGALDDSERRIRLEGLVQTAPALRLPAEEQLALLDLREGHRDASVERLQRIVADADVTQDLRRRASQLIVSLGGQPQPAGQ
ncbi:tetratricopeptide repeat protein [Thalassovita sp.]|uniref:tetratricopeptide repeat protein n=1 Tax=Thalassovita sp. TaxID=1979401 RepID=UPI0029DE5A71|nr:tetratricopeptide repeat protein [Thalassovita sp.]